MPPEETSRALHAGELADVLTGRDPGKDEGGQQAQQTAEPRPVGADQGARPRTGIEQLTELELMLMSPQETVRARKQGRLRDLGFAP